MIKILYLTVCFAIAGVIGDFLIQNPMQASDFTINGNAVLVDPAFIRLTLNIPEVGTGGTVIYNTFQEIESGFIMDLTYQSFDCDDLEWKGADGFSMVLSPVIIDEVPASYGSSLAITNLTNIMAVAFLANSGTLRLCGTDADSNLGGGSLYFINDKCSEVQAPEILAIRCANGTHNIRIRYSPPGNWQVLLNGTEVAFVDNFIPSNYFPETLLAVGLTGGTGYGYMRQQISEWSFNGIKDVLPYLECYQDLGSANYRAHLGYENFAPTTVNEPAGPSNTFEPAFMTTLQPTSFLPGRTLTYPLAAFTVDWDGSEITWRLTDYRLTWSRQVDRLCPRDLRMEIRFATLGQLSNDSLAALLDTIANFTEISSDRVTSISMNYSPIQQTKKRQLFDSEAVLVVEISSADPDYTGEPSAEEAVIDFINASKNATIIDAVLNPNSTEGRVLIGVKPIGDDISGEFSPDPEQVTSPQQVLPPKAATPSTGTPLSSTPSSGPTSTPLSTSIASNLYNSLVLPGLCIVVVIFVNIFV